MPKVVTHFHATLYVTACIFMQKKSNYLQFTQRISASKDFLNNSLSKEIFLYFVIKNNWKKVNNNCESIHHIDRQQFSEIKVRLK